MKRDEIETAVTSVLGDVVADLGALVEYPSVSAPGFSKAPVMAAASATAELLTRYGVPDVQLLDVPDGYPAVWADVPGPAEAPTVLLYAHYDVVPATFHDGWTSEPWTMVERAGRLYGRGTADNKSGIVMHAAAMHVFGGRVPVSVKILIEGEEETTSHLHDLIVKDPARFAANVVVVADMGNLATGEPALTTSLRGDLACVITVRTLDHSLHSGEFGGPIPDAMMVLVRVLDRLVDEHGEVAALAVHEAGWTGHTLQADRLRRDAAVLKGVKFIGRGSLAARLWSKPAVTIIGVDAPGVAEASNRLLPEASAKVSFRIPAGQDPQAAASAITDHVRTAVPWGAQVGVDFTKSYAGFSTPEGGAGMEAARDALEEAYGRPCATIGSGASVPLLAVLGSAMPDAEFVLLGAADLAMARAHGTDESVDRKELERMIVAEALLLERLGAHRGD